MFEAVLTGLESVVFLYTSQQAIEQEVAYSKLKKLYEEHQSQFKNMSTIYELCQKLYFEQALIDQIKTTQLYTLNQWGLLSEVMNSQIDFLKSYNKDYANMLVQMQNKKETELTNYLTIIVYFLGFVFQAWKLYRIKYPLSPPAELISQWRDFDGQNYYVQIANAKKGDVLFVQVKTPSMADFQAQMALQGGLNRKRFQQLKNWAEKNLNSKSQHGIRILFLAYTVYSAVTGRIDLQRLYGVLNDTRDYFAKQGGFNQKQQKVSEALLTISSNIYTIVNISYSAILQLHDLYLTRSMVEPINSNYYFMKAAEMTPDQIGLNQPFLGKCKNFVNQMISIKKMGKNVADELVDFMNIYTKYLGDGTISQQLVNNLTIFSAAVAKDSIVSSSLHENQQKYISLLNATKRRFFLSRGTNFQALPVDKKIQIDRSILNILESNYKLLFLQDDMAQLNQTDKKTLMHIISNFCSKFYGTDPKGQSIYNFQIQEGQYTYSDLLDDVSDKTEGRIRIKLTDPKAEDEELERMVELIKTIGAQKILTEASQVKKGDILYRYTRVIMKEAKKINQGGVLSKVVGIQGAAFKIGEIKYFVEQEIISKFAKLEKYAK